MEALTHALGGKARVGPTASWWAAAARARAPQASDAAVEARHPGLGPDAATAATHTWTVQQHTTSGGYTFHYLRVECAVRPP
ncbi:hypothetical protein [Vitiosangium sp. GDMCC 1.1324]|uniref:hypothetical protein n=1 Tax=Vitiosangium sp. (strain GDMCC 1.1324) TaxID=2138576 RepID=UPI000D35D112|nr:hypothetical protein [Vitiosangium sp. GDMCC 1.1324]PTL74941.1 hypothetical protein DAT35_57550 [Vitiosangium sp. GDMCC 1.1324]